MPAHRSITTWSRSSTSTASPGTGSPRRRPTSAGVTLAEQLTALSAAAWRTYTHGGRFTEPGETNTEARRVAEDRKDFDEVAQMIGDPYLWPYSPVLSSAKTTGQLLATLDTSEVTAAVLREVDVKLAAVTNAELGDLSGRAAQAVVLTRWSGSPTQVQAAHEWRRRTCQSR